MNQFYNSKIFILVGLSSLILFNQERQNFDDSILLNIELLANDLNNEKKKYYNSKNEADETAIESEFAITFAGAKIVYNNHVGNEWISYGKIMGKNLFLNETIIVKINESQILKVVSHLQETEEKHIDWAEETVNLDYRKLSSLRGTGFVVSVTIKESNGRYAGNTAQMKFVYYVN